MPGVLDTNYNQAGTNPVNLCEHCGAGGMDRCQRNTRELYYGDSGAFRCLVESMCIFTYSSIVIGWSDGLSLIIMKRVSGS